jgi:hypothetical protein
MSTIVPMHMGHQMCGVHSHLEWCVLINNSLSPGQRLGLPIWGLRYAGRCSVALIAYFSNVIL